MAGNATVPPKTASRRNTGRTKTVATSVTETVQRVPEAPEVAGGAVTLGAPVNIDRETLFYVDGIGYTIPKSFGPNAALGYAHIARTLGQNAAIDWAMEKALGTVGYAVLRDQDDLTQDQLDNMITLIIARIEGLPDPKPKSS